MELLMELLMGLSLIIIGISLIFYNGFSEFIVTKILKKRYNFNYRTTADVLCYVGEILMMFGLFHVSISILQPYINYDEPSSLKMFIDFFTVYQIGVLVILRLINASSIREYKKQLGYIETVRYLSGIEMSAEHVLKDIKYILGGHLPFDVERRYKSLEEVLHKYEDTISDTSYEKDTDLYHQEMSKFIALLSGVLDSMVIKVNSEIDTLSNEWEASLFLRRVRLISKRKYEEKLAEADLIKENK